METTFDNLANDVITEISHYLSASDKNTFRCCESRIAKKIEFDPEWKLDFLLSDEFKLVWENIFSVGEWKTRHRTVQTRYGHAWTKHNVFSGGMTYNIVYLNNIKCFEFFETGSMCRSELSPSTGGVYFYQYNSYRYSLWLSRDLNHPTVKYNNKTFRPSYKISM